MKIYTKLTEDILDAAFDYAENEKKKDGEVRLSKVLPVIGAVCTLIFLIPAVILGIQGHIFPEIIMFALFFSFGIFLIIGYFNCRIRYDDDGFIRKNIVGIKKRFDYADITGIRRTERDSYILVGKKKILIDGLAVGGKDFIRFINRKYNQVYGKNVPVVSVSEKDIFKGNLRNPEEVKTAFVVCYAVIAVTVVFLAFVLSADGEEKITTVSETIASCDTYKVAAGQNMVLLSTDGDEYLIRNIPKKFDTAKIENFCDSKTQVKLDIVEETKKDGNVLHIVKGISVNEKNILSRDETAENEKNMAYDLLIIIAAFFTGFVTIFLAIIIFAGRNAKKYPKLALKVFKKSQLTGYELKHHKKRK